MIGKPIYAHQHEDIARPFGKFIKGTPHEIKFRLIADNLFWRGGIVRDRSQIAVISPIHRVTLLCTNMVHGKIVGNPIQVGAYMRHIIRFILPGVFGNTQECFLCQIHSNISVAQQASEINLQFPLMGKE